MSFGGEIKKELSMLNNLANKEEVKYELYGYFLSENISEKNGKIEFSTESEYNINRFAKLLRNMNIDDFSIDIQGKVYSITLKTKELTQINVYEIELEKIKKEQLVKAIVRGIFMGSGSINNPENTYHLEIGLIDLSKVKTIISCMLNYDIKLKSVENTIYIKDGEEISKFLAFIGAAKSVLRFEEIRVQKHMNNKVNRLVNCKTANLEKTMNASAEQIAAIGRLKTSGEFQKLDENLKELAELRLEYPSLPLGELGKLLSTPIGKSGVNYRLKKIIELSK